MEQDDIDPDDIFMDEDLPPKKEEIVISDEDMKRYYSELFPYEEYFKWFGKNESSYFEKREFSFTKRGDIYIRFLCFENAKALRDGMLQTNPIKIDVGAVYNTPPKYRTSSSTNFTPEQKELVFDIDMTDYDDVRTCCKEAKICNKCWKYMIIAYRILNQALQEDFGFSNIMWVFSGRRGIHCWVGDERARKLGNEARGAIAGYLNWKKINKNVGLTNLMKKPLHPSIQRALEIISKDFKSYVLEGQDIMNSASIKEVIQIIVKAYFANKVGYNGFEEEVKKILNLKKNSCDKWYELATALERFDGQSNPNFSKFDLCLKEIQMAIMYPRLDINVSKHINHLLKSPFCVHPKTGLVSVPLNEESIVNFDISLIPTLKEALEDHKNKIAGKYVNFLGIFRSLIPNMNLPEKK